jgi:hypothetical protein
MGTHRRKWGWWLVAALAVVLAASLLFRRCPGAPSGPALVDVDSSSVSVPVVRDTVYVEVGGGTVPIVRERPAEVPGKASGKASGGASASGEESGETSGGASGAVSGGTPDAAPAAVETIVSVPVKDIAGLIRQKSGRDIGLSTKAPDRISVSYGGKVDIPLLGEQKMDFSADFRVVEVKGDRLVLQLDNGAAMNAAADLVAPHILQRLPAGLVESFSSGRAVVNLSAVPSLKKQLKSMDIVGFSVDEETIRLRTVRK